MNEKEILSKIKSEVENNTPNILNRIDLNSINIDEPIISKKKEFNIMNLFKVLVPLTSLILIVSLVVLIGTNNERNKPTIFNPSKKDLTVASYTSSAMEVLNIENNSVMTKINSHINSFKNYEFLLEEYLNLVDTEVVISTNNDKTYNYDYKMIVKQVSFNGDIKNYEMYYNQEGKSKKDETENNMLGILIINGLLFNFEAELESSNDESEIEVIITNNEGYKIEIEKETEAKEYEMNYTIYNNKQIIKEISFEVEDDTMELEILEYSNNIKYENKFELNKVEVYYYEIEDDNGNIFTLNIDIENNKFIYNSLNNSNLNKELFNI